MIRLKKYKYSAINLSGKKFEGTFLAENEKDLRRQLAKQNLYLVSARPDTEKSPNPFFSLTGKVTVNELSTFCRQFSIMITSGTSIVDSLSILRTQSFTGYLKKILSQVYEDVKAGKLLSEALDKHKRVFPDFFRSMVRVGELSGPSTAYSCRWPTTSRPTRRCAPAPVRRSCIPPCSSSWRSASSC